jgi:hypothetical protein
VNAFKIKGLELFMKTIWIYLLLLAIGLNLIGCSDKIEAAPSYDFPRQLQPVKARTIAEVAPPSTIQELNKSFQQYEPQVEIINPKSDSVFKEDRVNVKLQVKNLPIFKDPKLEMGPHLHLILDNEPARSIYDLDKPLLLENLAPGTHTIRVFAVRPWNESFKNEGAYAQTTFHILTKTRDNNPDPSQTLLTYNSPSGTYGAEPILLDFYLTNAPLHLVAKEDPDFKDWRIRVTVNDESFIVDRWQSIYLKGFEKGNNWLQLEFIDEDGNNIDNVFNNTVRLITYDPKQKDTLSQLVQDKLSTQVARAIVEPNYIAKPTPAPSIEVTPEPEPEITTVKPSQEEPKAQKPIAPPEIEIPQEKPKVEIPVEPEKAKNSLPEAIEPKSSTPEIKEPVIEEKADTTETDSKVEEVPTVTPETTSTEKTATEKPKWLLGLQNRWQQVKESASESVSNASKSISESVSNVSKSVSQIKLPKTEIPKSTVKDTPSSEEIIEEKIETEAIEKIEIPQQQTTVENEIESEL